MSMYNEVVVVGETKGGKQVAYRVPEGKSLYQVYLVGGGQLPPSLAGEWNDTRQIENAVKIYLQKDLDSNKSKRKPVRAKKENK